MKNMYFRDPISGISGKVTDTVVMGDGKGLARIEDHWLFEDGLVPDRKHKVMQALADR